VRFGCCLGAQVLRTFDVQLVALGDVNGSAVNDNITKISLIKLVSLLTGKINRIYVLLLPENFSERIRAFETAQLPLAGTIGLYLQVQLSY
jgi:hypothetical protein